MVSGTSSIQATRRQSVNGRQEEAKRVIDVKTPDLKHVFMLPVSTVRR
jgi:hypothetical protein